MLRIMGIDPGLRITGWGIIDSAGNKLRYVAGGVFVPNATQPLAQRLHTLHSSLLPVMQQYEPQALAIEKTLVNTNAEGSLKLAHARAMAMLAAAQCDIAVHEYAPTTIKKAATGSGTATKENVIRMMRLLLPGCVLNTADAADALAIAVCHAHHAPLLQRGAA